MALERGGGRFLFTRSMALYFTKKVGGLTCIFWVHSNGPLGIKITKSLYDSFKILIVTSQSMALGQDCKSLAAIKIQDGDILLMI